MLPDRATDQGAGTGSPSLIPRIRSTWPAAMPTSPGSGFPGRTMANAPHRTRIGPVVQSDSRVRSIQVSRGALRGQGRRAKADPSWRAPPMRVQGPVGRPSTRPIPKSPSPMRPARRAPRIRRTAAGFPFNAPATSPGTSPISTNTLRTTVTSSLCRVPTATNGEGRALLGPGIEGNSLHSLREERGCPTAQTS